jgi:transposase-like protein
MSQIYSDAFVEQARVKVLSRGTRTYAQVAKELNISFHTLKGWMGNKTRVNKNAVLDDAVPTKESAHWTVAQQLEALQLTHGLTEVQLGAWCRERGLFVHQLQQWKAAFLSGASAVPAPVAATGELRSLKEQNNQLKRELLRKDKALAEAGALLVLQKKFRALWEDEGNS